jgi:hypothetical protein
MGVATACLEVHDAVAQATRLALNPCKPSSVVDYEVGARVLSERKIDCVSDALQGDRNG